MLPAGIAERPVGCWRNIAGGAVVLAGLMVSLLLMALPIVREASISHSSVEFITADCSVRDHTGARGSWRFG